MLPVVVSKSVTALFLQFVTAFLLLLVIYSLFSVRDDGVFKFECVSGVGYGGDIGGDRYGVGHVGLCAVDIVLVAPRVRSSRVPDYP